MQEYKSKFGTLPATSYDESVKLARKGYNTLRSPSKRQHYVRSKYFGGEKIFIKLVLESSSTEEATRQD